MLSTDPALKETPPSKTERLKSYFKAILSKDKDEIEHPVKYIDFWIHEEIAEEKKAWPKQVAGFVVIFIVPMVLYQMYPVQAGAYGLQLEQLLIAALKSEFNNNPKALFTYEYIGLVSAAYFAWHYLAGPIIWFFAKLFAKPISFEEHTRRWAHDVYEKDKIKLEKLYPRLSNPLNKSAPSKELKARGENRE